MKIKSYLIIAALIAGGLFINDYFANKRDLKRQNSNNENLRQELKGFKDSLSSNLTSYQLKTTSELRDYLSSTNSQLNGIEDDLKDVNINLRKVNRIVSTTIQARDTIINKINLDSLADKLRALRPFKIPFSEKSDCFYIRGEFDFDGEKYSINLLEKQYTDTLTHVSSWERKKHRWLFGIKTGLFGKKTGKLTLFNNCGETKTIILDKL